MPIYKVQYYTVFINISLKQHPLNGVLALKPVEGHYFWPNGCIQFACDIILEGNVFNIVFF